MYYLTYGGRMPKIASSFGTEKLTVQSIISCVIWAISSYLFYLQMRTTLRIWYQSFTIPMVFHNVLLQKITRVQELKGHHLTQVTLPKRKKKYALSIQVAVDYNYCFSTDDKMTRERTCVSIFSNSKLNAMLREGTVPAVGKLSLKENHLYLSVFRKMQHIHFCLT